ncbi:VOC family protein [Candidatus Gottesmanbacteria bacterium]|nr:VOC family protein [Candidatus Gottesmanbacteria bacterium]
MTFENENWARFDINGATFGIHRLEEEREEIDMKNLGGQVTFAVDDVHKAYTELKNKGVKFITEVIEQPWADLAKFVDPDGNVLNIRKGK